MPLSAASAIADNNHTLKGQDWNNVAPRVGFAWTPGTDQWVVRGGYGIFYDRPSAAFINTVFSNYPFLREQEVTFPAGAVPIDACMVAAGSELSLQPVSAEPDRPDSRRRRHVSDPRQYQRDRGADGTSNPVDPATGLPTRGNIAETFEFRAVDRNLHTPYVQQYNFGVQRDLGRNMVFEVRYVGSKGTDLLEVSAFNQGYDLNAPGVPDHIFERFNLAYIAAGARTAR